MQILISIERLNSLNAGGIENVSWQIAKEFERCGHKVYFLSLLTPIPENEIEEFCSENRRYVLPDSKNIDSEVNLAYLEQLIEQNDIDIVLNQNGNNLQYSNILFKVRDRIEKKIKIVSAHHFNPDYLIKDINDSYFIADRLRLNIFKWLKAIVRFIIYKLFYLNVKNQRLYRNYLEIYNKSDAYVLLSKTFIYSFLKDTKIKSGNKLFAISNPVCMTKERTLVDEKEKVILYVGRLVRSQKRVDRVLSLWYRIYRDYPDWKLVIVGEGGYRSCLEEFVDKNGIERVEFKGRQNPTEYYKIASIFTMVSTIEGFGLVLAEAQQAGCVPMAYNSFESVTDIIDDGEDGVLVTSFSSKEYERKLRVLMDDENLRERMMNNCMNKDYSRFDVKNVAKQWIELFENLQNL
ncbi:MAG: glycosyltransferase [Rikenellaceae bacterium]